MLNLSKVMTFYQWLIVTLPSRRWESSSLLHFPYRSITISEARQIAFPRLFMAVLNYIQFHYEWTNRLWVCRG